ncbi:MAG: hypothetical protein HY900_11260 [Deltaproteobacteria bacterium]|nr:hypothetical protein [Deltaproteobacteria bacterium]
MPEEPSSTLRAAGAEAAGSAEAAERSRETMAKIRGADRPEGGEAHD